MKLELEMMNYLACELYRSTRGKSYVTLSEISYYGDILHDIQSQIYYLREFISHVEEVVYDDECSEDYRCEYANNGCTCPPEDMVLFCCKGGTRLKVEEGTADEF